MSRLQAVRLLLTLDRVGNWMRSRQKYIFAGIPILLVLAFGTSLSFIFPLSTNTMDRVGVSRKSGTPLTSPSEKPVPPSSAAVPPLGTVANTTSEALSLGAVLLWVWIVLGSTQNQQHRLREDHSE